MPEPTIWRILVVEDRAGISASLLRARSDFEVAAVHRLQAVERIFRERPGSPFQAVLFDLSLADIADPQGLDAFRRVRAMAPGVPIVVLAPATAEEAPLALAAEGAAACLPRQSTTAEVLAWTLRQAVLKAEGEARRYRDLFDSVPVGILLAAGRRVAMANPAVLKHLGYSSDDMARASVLDLFPAGMRASLESALDACVAGEAREATFSASLVRKDGSPAPAHVILKGALLNDAPALAFYLTFPPAAAGIADMAQDRDRMAHRAPRMMPEGPAPAAGPGGESAGRMPALDAARKMEALGRLAGGIAHDFNNLFTAINGYSDHLLTLPGAEGAMARGLTSIRKAGEAAAAMVRGLMAFSHPGSGEPRVFRVDSLIDEAAPMLSSLLGGALELRIRPGAGPAGARLEPGQLEQILANLCTNAREATAQSGAVALATETVDAAGAELFTHLKPSAPGPYVVISVRDTGRGMTQDELERLCEPYYSTKTVKGGGYGLATVYGIVSQAGGGIAVTSRPGQGSLFRVWLPRVDAEAAPGSAFAGAAAAASAATAVATAGSARREAGPGAGAASEEGPARLITVVEDEPTLREMLRAVLERYGFEVREATSGGEAEDDLAGADRLPDLLVSDVLLRDGLGTEMADRLRESHPGLRILFISGHSLETLSDQGITIAPEDFLEKPFTPSQLAAKVKACLAAATRPSAPSA